MKREINYLSGKKVEISIGVIYFQGINKIEKFYSDQGELTDLHILFNDKTYCKLISIKQ